MLYYYEIIIIKCYTITHMPQPLPKRTDGAALVGLAAVELDELVFSDHDFLDAGGEAHDRVGPVGLVEGGDDLGAGGHRESLDALEVRVLDHHHALIREQLLRVVVHQLSVHEHVRTVSHDLLNLIN